MTEVKGSQEDTDMTVLSGRNPTFAEIEAEIANMLTLDDSELDESQKTLLDEYLNLLGEQEASKVDSFARFIKLQSAHVAACKEEAKRLSSKAKTAEERIAYLKHQYLTTMQFSGLKKIHGNAYTLSMRKTESAIVPESDIELAKLHETYPEYVHMETIYKPDKTSIKEAIKAGVVIPGCEIRENMSLQIR